MKKQLVTAAVAAALAAPVVAHAEANWYGSIRNSIGWVDDNTTDDFDIRDHSSRIGVKGANDLGNGLEVPYRFELQLSSEDSTGVKGGRLGRIGLRGGFGTVHVGQLWGPYYNHISWVDQFNSVGFAFGRSNFRIGNAIRYDLPATGGFSLQAAVSGDKNDNGENVDQTNIGGSWSNDQFGVGVGWIDFKDAPVKNDLFGVTAYGNFGAFGLGVLYEDEKVAGEAVHVVGNYTSGPNVYRAGWAKDDTTKDDALTLGWQHNLGSASRVAVEFEKIKIKNGSDTDKLRFFIRTDF